ncbi:MAG: NAD(P)H-dependent oxidoreductase subunit E, partial [Deltaproteobacteria bacterium]|nr:NAD(P)H-dependent oxidoreductase subunit E [Deltaproteobacteria bacterium]
MGFEKVDRILKKNGNETTALVDILHDIQNEYYYLPQDIMKRLAEKLGIPLSRIYSTATFFKAFSLEPRGRHLISVCLGTACHVRGGPRIVDQIGSALDIEAGETTEDRNFTLDTVNCVGCCAIGPVMVVDGKYFGGVSAKKVLSVLKK